MSINQENISQANIDNDEISLKQLILKMKEWFTFLKSKWKIIFLAGIIGGVIGLTIAWFEKPTYKATLTFAMEEDKGGSGGLSGALGLASSFGIDLGGAGGGGAFAASNLSALMKSHLIIEKVLLDSYNINGKTRTLADYYIEVEDLRNKWSKKPILKNIQFLPNADRSKFNRVQDSILFQLHKELTKKENLDIIQKDKKVTIIAIEVNSKDELFSKLFCEAVANETSEFYIQTKSKKARMNTSVLQRQADSVRAVLNNNITGVAKETDNVYNLNPSFNVRGANSKKIQVDVTANTEVLKQLIVQLELSKITLRKETPLIQMIDRPVLPLEKEKFGKLRLLILGSVLSGFSSILFLILVQMIKRILE
jgi:uncharacterized protein involved in exopolysaccharide biosynthesis